MIIIFALLGLIDRLAGWWIDWRMGLVAAKLRREGDPTGGPEVEFVRAELTPLGADLTLRSPAVAILADQAAFLLQKHGGPNYIQFDMLARIDYGERPLRVTIQYAEGLAPATKVSMLERERDELREQVEQLRRDLDHYARQN